MFRHTSRQMRTPGMHLPPFHAMGFILEITLPLYTCAIVALFPPVVKRADIVPRMPAPDVILDQIRKTESNAILILPTYLQSWASDQEAIDILRHCEFVVRLFRSFIFDLIFMDHFIQAYSGGAISSSVGQLMRASGVKLQTVYGSTEFGALAMSSGNSSNAEDWDHMEFPPEYNIHWAPQGDGTFECQILVSCSLRLAEAHYLPNLLD